MGRTKASKRRQGRRPSHGGAAAAGRAPEADAAAAAEGEELGEHELEHAAELGFAASAAVAAAGGGELDGVMEGGQGSSLNSVLAQLDSEEAGDREMACSTLAQSFQDAGGVGEAEVGALPSLAARLLPILQSDASLAVHVEACAALRNMLLSTPDAAAPALMAYDAVGVLGEALNQAEQELQTAYAAADPASVSPGEVTAWQAVCEHALSALQALLTSLDAAVDRFNELGLLEPVVTAVCAEGWLNLTQALAAAECFQVASENNPASGEMLAGAREVLDALVAVIAGDAVEGSAARLRAATSAALGNMHDALGPGVLEPVFLAASSLLSHHHLVSIGEIASSGQPAAVLNEMIGAVADTLAAQQTVLELLANIFVNSLSDDDEWEDVGDDDDDSAAAAASSAAAPGPELAPEVRDAFLASGLIDLIVLKCTSLDHGMQQILNGRGDAGQELLRQQASLQMRAVGCLGNMLPALGPQCLAPDLVGSLWAALFDLGTSPPMGCDPDFIETVAAALWALLRTVVAAEHLRASLVVPPAHVEQICQLAKSAGSEDIRAQSVGILGCLGTLPALAGHLQPIGETLVHALNADASLLVQAEALNAIFDVFAEPETNAVVVAVGMMDALAAAHASFKARIKAHRHAVGRELYARLDEARINLRRFLEYKQPQF